MLTLYIVKNYLSTPLVKKVDYKNVEIKNDSCYNKRERGNNMKKCDYCAKEITYFEQFCCEECEQKHKKYYDDSERHSKKFMVLNTIFVFAIPIGLFFGAFNKFVGIPMAAICCVLQGIMLILLPMPTEGMIKKRKLKNAIKVSRIFGCVVIGLGLLIVGMIFILP